MAPAKKRDSLLEKGSAPKPKVSGVRKSSRLQNKPPALAIPQTRSQNLSTLSPTPIAPKKRPRKKRFPNIATEADEPKKKNSQAAAHANDLEILSGEPQEPPPLSGEDLTALNSLYQAVMTAKPVSPPKEPTANSPLPTSSGVAHSSYRRVVLLANKIHLHAIPSSTVDARIKDILCSPGNEESLGDDIRRISQDFSNECRALAEEEDVEEGFLQPLHQVIKSLKIQNLRITRNSAWRSELKPTRPTASVDVNDQLLELKTRALQPPLIMAVPKPKSKRKTQKTTTKPLATSPSKDRPPCAASNPSCVITTPKPDMTLGVDVEALLSVVSREYMGEISVVEFFEALENAVEVNPDEAEVPMVIMRPILHATRLAYPFLVVEAKSYSTGKQLFEAENQVVGAMACANNMLRFVDRLNNESSQHVIFSITSQGPVHELWAQWIDFEGLDPIFNCKLYDSWNVLLSKQALGLVSTLRTLCSWGTTQFLESVAENLQKLMEPLPEDPEQSDE